MISFWIRTKASEEVSACLRARASLGLFGWLLPNTANVMESTKMEVRSLFYYSFETRTLTLKKTPLASNVELSWVPRALEMSPITLYGWCYIPFFHSPSYIIISFNQDMPMHIHDSSCSLSLFVMP